MKLLLRRGSAAAVATRKPPVRAPLRCLVGEAAFPDELEVRETEDIVACRASAKASPTGSELKFHNGRIVKIQ